MRPDDNRYGGYTLYEWIIGDYSGAAETKKLNEFGYPGHYDTSSKVYKKPAQ